jgi:predicted small lipoprotein YifL
MARRRTGGLVRSVAVASSLLVGLAVASCGSSAPSSAPPAATAAPADGTPKVLSFTADRLGGGKVAGASLAGRPVAFWFWAPT